MVYNLCSERSYDPAKFNNRVKIFPFDDHNPPPLRMIPRLCASVDEFLAEHPENVVVLHCKVGARSRSDLGAISAAYLGTISATYDLGAHPNLSALQGGLLR